MTNIDKQLRNVISEDRIYNSKLVAHLDWNEGNKHLLIATSFIEKRYILLDQDHKDLNLFSKNLFFTEVIKDARNNKPLEGISNYIEEKDWLGKFAFLLETSQFNTKSARELIEGNYAQLIYIENKASESIEFLDMDICVGFDNENNKWCFCWVKHDHPFYMEQGILCPRKNCVTENMGIIWCTKKQVDYIIHHITLITRKFKKHSSYFKSYPTPRDFLDDFLGTMNDISNQTKKIAELDDWSSKALSEYSVK
ncbi:hypothetical protein [Bacillus sp. V5-8f]|uniref:hypothetical protein n=1 Tax=Bacillus sp. V5-8f TaxID=2053044 RepID=UPI000C77BBCB|nr:hypothetical protein [Bacillus sp. V5-8f]PLT34126.1 hypothetical protein CUU64_07775 [Bacillus sp. V5-8f]